MNFVNIKHLTLDEILKYGCNGDLPVMSIADWNTLSEKIESETVSLEEYNEKMSELEDELKEEYEAGREAGYEAGYEDAMEEKDGNV